MTPDPIQNAASAFDKLPGIGPRAALRYAHWLGTQPKELIEQFIRNILTLTSLKACENCFIQTQTTRCLICEDTKRDNSILCIVATSQDVDAIEQTGVFKGRYHVLGGLIDPIEGLTPETLKIRELFNRLKNEKQNIQELILALDTDLKGDTTTLYLRKQLAPLNLRITRLARGLPTGAALEYADAHTLADALLNRKETK